jgi:exosome complex RNA-binding protein Csl4
MTPEEHYNKICKPQNDAMLAEIKNVSKQVATVNDRLFKTNGKEALVTTIAKNQEAVTNVSEALIELKKHNKAGLKFGPLELSNFEPRDLLRAAVVIFIVYFWLDSKGKLPDFMTIEKDVKAVQQLVTVTE